jgi:hypothetical protein
VTLASPDDLLGYLADLIQELERHALTLLPPDDKDEVVLGREPDGSLIVDLSARFPAARHSRDVDLDIVERWRPRGDGQWLLTEYKYELRHHELEYRRALHRHHEDSFVRASGLASHEHCEATMGVVDCDHYGGQPVRDAFDAFRRLYAIWLEDSTPDCSSLICLD